MDKTETIDKLPQTGLANSIGLVDADIIAYRCAAAGEEDDLDQVLISTENFIKDMYRRVKLGKYIFFLTGEGNFRYDVAKRKPYKGNRADMEKPRHLLDVKGFLVEYYNAMICSGFEADDALATCASRYGSSAVVMTIDKDLLQVPGYHYNFVKDERYFVSAEAGAYNLWKQVITGDTTDNIPGLPKFGPAKFDKFLLANPNLSPAEAAWQMYKDAGEEHPYFVEQMLLVRMLTDLQALPYEEHMVLDTFDHSRDDNSFTDNLEGFDDI